MSDWFGACSPGLLVVLLVMLLMAGATGSYAANERHADYQPLFSKQMLEQADAATRERLQALDERNYQRWLEQRPTLVPDPTQTGQPNQPVQPPEQRKRATLYQYTDAQGNVQFTDQYVDGAKPVAVAVPKPSESSQAEHAARQQEQSQMLDYFKERDQQQQRTAAQEQRKSQAQAEHQSKCRQMFLDIQDTQRGGSVYYDLDAAGERVYLSAAQLRDRLEEMKSGYRANCGALPPIAE